MKYILIVALFTVFLGCREFSKTRIQVNSATLTDTMTNSDEKSLVQKEDASLKKQNDSFGNLLTTIAFNVKTNNIKEFKDGLIPWASIEKPENDIPQLIDRNEIVVEDTTVKIVIDYPLTNVYTFSLVSKNGFTRAQLLREISRNYYKVYEEEEQSATIKTLPAKKRTTMYNRNQTNGKYGIWGHDVADLVLAEALVYKTNDGQIVITLNIYS